MQKENELTEEKEKLRKTINLARKGLEEAESAFERLEKNTYDEYSLFTIRRTYLNKIKNLQKALENPYFARVDFQEKEKEEQKIYIGKTNIFDEDLKVAVADWRAPIASIYYDGQIGDAKYECPEGMIEGKLMRKRQYIIREANLMDYYDIEITTNDTMLQEALKEKSDIRLKNIVATIQKEQNEIIRADMFQPLIVQGVAGSGKTTVALHRIAYLVYTYEKEFRPEDFLIIGPNKFFLDYISNVLPDLGVDYVRQQTFEELASSILKEKLNIEDGNLTLQKIVDRVEDTKEIQKIKEISTFKSSIKFKEWIDNYLKILNENLLPKEDFKIADILVIKQEELQEMLLEGKDKISLEERVERLKKFMQNRVANLSEKITEQMIKTRSAKIEKIDLNLSQEKQLHLRKSIFEQTEYEINSLLKNKGKQLVNDYIKKVPKYTPIQIYKQIMNCEELANDTEYASDIKNIFNKKIKKKQVEYEDLAPIMYIQYKTLKMNEKFNLKHIIIDEAQDFSEFQFSVLYEILNKNKSITILGDIAQGIYSYRGTSDWERINNLIFENQAKIVTLEKSYRTTAEIMEEANKVLSKIRKELNVKLAVPISRNGRRTKYTEVKDWEDTINKISESIIKSKEEGYENIGIIARDSILAQKIYNTLKGKFENIELISEKLETYKGGITIVPSYFSKGLEFDSVIITDYKSYDSNPLDIKLLYVAMTRAMHKLEIFAYNNLK